MLKDVAHSKKILSCEQFRPFWLSWKHGHLGFGQGSIPGQEVLLEVQDPDPVPVYDLVVKMGMWADTKGEWIFFEFC